MALEELNVPKHEVMSMVQLKLVTKGNLDAVLALKVNDCQTGFVSTTAESLAQAYVYTETAFPFAVCNDQWILQSIMDGLSALQAEVKSVTLTCDRETLIRRWKNDFNCEWRTDHWLEISLASLPYFSSMKDVIDTSELSVDQIADMIMGDY